MTNAYQADIDRLLSTQRCNGGELWSTADGAIAKGVPFSTLEAAMTLRELGYDDAGGELARAAALMFANLRDDGRIKVYASGTIYPCQTATADGGVTPRNSDMARRPSFRIRGRR